MSEREMGRGDIKECGAARPLLPHPHSFSFLTRRHIVELDVKEREQAGEGVHRPPVLEVADHGHREAVQLAPELRADRVCVEQCLGGVLPRPVAGVEDGLGGRSGRDRGAALLRVPQDDRVGVALHRLDAVRQRLALDGAGRRLQMGGGRGGGEE
jgi:hypothetical protein